MIHHYPLLVLHGISQWWRVYCIVIIFAWINFVWNVLVLLLKKQKQGVWLARNIWLNYEGRRPEFTTRKRLWRVRAPRTRGMAWSGDGEFVKIEQRPQDRPSLWHWIRSSINWCPSAISSIYRQKDNLLSKEVRVEFLLTKFCNRTFRSQVYQKHIKFTSIGLQIYLRMNMMKRKNINETVASDCGWAVIGTCLTLVSI